MIGEEVMKTEAICALGELTLVYYKLGDCEKAYETAERALVYIRPMKPVTFWLQPVMSSTCEALLSMLEAGWAPNPTVRTNLRIHARHAVAALRRFSRHFQLGRPPSTLWAARLAWIEGRHRRAVRLWHETLSLADRLGTPYESALAHFELGRRGARLASEQARHLEESAAIFETLGCTAECVEVRTELSRTLAEVPTCI